MFFRKKKSENSVQDIFVSKFQEKLSAVMGIEDAGERFLQLEQLAQKIEDEAPQSAACVLPKGSVDKNSGLNGIKKEIEQATQDLLKNYSNEIAKSPQADDILNNNPWYLPQLSAAFKAAGKDPQQIVAPSTPDLQPPHGQQH